MIDSEVNTELDVVENESVIDEAEVFSDSETAEVVEAAELEASEVENVDAVDTENIEASELKEFESAEIEEEEFISLEQMESIIESILFASDRPTSLSSIKQVFKGTNISTRQIKKALEALEVEYASAHRGVTLEMVNGGYQLRSKVDNMDYLRRMIKARPFRLSGPAMEVMSIVAYEQPLVKARIDEIRGVESGHLLRALMEKGLVCFAGKSELPGKPMLYASTRKFLEVFALRSLKELPTLSEIDELLPEGIGEEEEKKQKLSDITGELAEDTAATTYSDGEEELLKITDQLADIETSSNFFEEEKRRQKEKRDRERAQDIQDALNLGEEVSDKDQKFLKRYQAAQEELAAQKAMEEEAPKAEEDQEVVQAEEDQEVVQAEAAEGVEVVTEESVVAPDLDPVIQDTHDGFIVAEAAEAIRAFEEGDDEAIIPIDEPASEQ